MKRFIAAVILAATATPALAAEPATLVMPTPLVGAMLQYLAHRPYDESAQMIGELQGCVAVQVPNKDGVIMSHGECPAVTDALAALTKQTEADKKQIADLTAKVPPAAKPEVKPAEKVEVKP